MDQGATKKKKKKNPNKSKLQKNYLKTRMSMSFRGQAKVYGSVRSRISC